ncbi:MAG: ArsR/SmtB family transcription factor [Huintestinicola sp.]
MDIDAKKTAVIFKAFCDENRIKILQLLQGGEKCACKLLEEMNITQPTLSHHMKILCDSGIVAGRREGKWMHYSISREGVRYAAQCMEKLTAVSEEDENHSCCEK